MHKNIKILTWFNFFTDFSFYAPIAIIYFAKVSGSYTLGMSVFSIVMFSGAVLEVPTGILSDYIGRKKTIILGAASAVLFVTFYAIGGSFWMLAVGAFFEGLSRSFYSGNNNALLHDTLAETNSTHEYEEYLGRVNSSLQVASAIAAITGGILAVWSFSVVMWLSVIPQLICLVLSFTIIEPRVHVYESGNVYLHLREAISNFIHNKKLRLISIASIITFGIGESTYTFRSAFFSTLWPVWAIGIARSLSGFGAAISFHFSGRVIKKFGHLKTLLFGFIYSRIINILFTLFPSVFSPVGMASTSLNYGVTTVAENSLMQKEFTDKQRATMESLNSLGGNLFYSVIAFGIGFVADVLTPGKALLLSQLFIAPVVLIYWNLFKGEKSSN